MFVENLNTNFSLQLDATQTVDLQLIEVREGRSSPRQEQFALLFQGPLATPFWQRTWFMRHAQLGEFELFLVPVGSDQDGLYYEAVFNRLLPPSAGSSRL